MKINYKVNIETQVPDAEIDEMLKETGKKLSDFRKLVESKFEQEVCEMFTQDELVNCKVKTTFKKEKEGDFADK